MFSKKPCDSMKAVASLSRPR